MRSTIHFRGERLLYASSILTCALLGACSRSDISERPPLQQDGTGPIANQPSTIGALVTVPMAQAIQAVNAALPKAYGVDWTNGPDQCARILWQNVCVGTKYKYSVTRGDVQLAPAGDAAIKVTVPVAVSGQGGFRGTGADILRLNAKNFDAAAVFDVILTPTLGQDWCPKVGVAATYRWTQNPRVEIVSRVNIDITGPVRDALDKKIPEITQVAQNAIDCTQIRSQIAAVYGKRTFPIDVSPTRKLHVNVEPSGLAFSGLSVDAQSIRLAALVTANVEVSAAPVAATALPLPPLKRLEGVAAPRIKVALPLRTPFTMLQDEAQKLLGGKTFEHETPAGRVKATVRQVSIYPTAGGRIAVGLEFDAKLPGRILDTKGAVFLTGTPVLEGKTLVRFKNVAFSRILDNDLWNGLSALFESKIRSTLEANLRYDFGADVERAKTALATKLADPTAISNVKVTVVDVDIGVGRIAVSGGELAAEALFGANVTVEPLSGAVVAQK
jgi:hypothetical protein